MSSKQQGLFAYFRKAEPKSSNEGISEEELIHKQNRTHLPTSPDFFSYFLTNHSVVAIITISYT